MSYTTDDLGVRFDEAANRAADRIEEGHDPYMAAAYGGPGKAAAPGYAARVCSAIAGDGRTIGILNQGTRERTRTVGFSRLWLDESDCYWVHCFSGNIPNPRPYRVYVCTALAHTHTVLRQLLQGYENMPLYFKVAAHDEAQDRNDTIVSWHQSLAHARVWAEIARANSALLEGEAPGGTFGGIDTRSVGIDTNLPGDTSTARIGRAAQAEVERRFARQFRNNPYI